MVTRVHGCPKEKSLSGSAGEKGDARHHQPLLHTRPGRAG